MVIVFYSAQKIRGGRDSFSIDMQNVLSREPTSLSRNNVSVAIANHVGDMHTDNSLSTSTITIDNDLHDVLTKNLPSQKHNSVSPTPSSQGSNTARESEILPKMSAELQKLMASDQITVIQTENTIEKNHRMSENNGLPVNVVATDKADVVSIRSNVPGIDVNSLHEEKTNINVSLASMKSVKRSPSLKDRLFKRSSKSNVIEVMQADETRDNSINDSQTSFEQQDKCKTGDSERISNTSMSSLSSAIKLKNKFFRISPSKVSVNSSTSGDSVTNINVAEAQDSVREVESSNANDLSLSRTGSVKSGASKKRSSFRLFKRPSVLNASRVSIKEEGGDATAERIVDSDSDTTEIKRPLSQTSISSDGKSSVTSIMDRFSRRSKTSVSSLQDDGTPDESKTSRFKRAFSFNKILRRSDSSVKTDKNEKDDDSSTVDRDSLLDESLYGYGEAGADDLASEAGFSRMSSDVGSIVTQDETAGYDHCATDSDSDTGRDKDNAKKGKLKRLDSIGILSKFGSKSSIDSEKKVSLGSKIISLFKKKEAEEKERDSKKSVKGSIKPQGQGKLFGSQTNLRPTQGSGSQIDLREMTVSSLFLQSIKDEEEGSADEEPQAIEALQEPSQERGSSLESAGSPFKSTYLSDSSGGEELLTPSPGKKRRRPRLFGPLRNKRLPIRQQVTSNMNMYFNYRMIMQEFAFLKRLQMRYGKQHEEVILKELNKRHRDLLNDNLRIKGVASWQRYLKGT